MTAAAGVAGKSSFVTGWTFGGIGSVLTPPAGFEGAGGSWAARGVDTPGRGGGEDDEALAAAAELPGTDGGADELVDEAARSCSDERRSHSFARAENDMGRGPVELGCLYGGAEGRKRGRRPERV